MNITPWKSGGPIRSRGRMGDEFTSFQREMNNLVNSFFNRGELTMPQMMRGMEYFPSLDIQEKDNRYFIDAEVPGMSEGDIDIEMHNNVLTIRGEKKGQSEKKEEGYMCMERTYGSFRREIPFEDEVDQENIKAEMKNGVLHLEIPKLEKSKSTHKKISIKH